MITPNYYVYLQEFPRSVYGLKEIRGYGHKFIMEVFVEDAKNITPEQAEKWCHKKNPTLKIFDIKNNEEMIYTYNKGYAGKQPSLFNIYGQNEK